MSAVATLNNDISVVDSTMRQFIAEGTVALTGSYPTNGDTLDLSQLGVPGNALPNRVEIFEATPASGKPASGYGFLYLPGTTLANGVMEMFNGTTQVTAQTYANLALPAAFVLRFRAWFQSFS